MLGEAGIENAEVVAEAGSHPIDSPDDWWLVAMGSGYRGTLAQLDTATFARVHRETLRSSPQATLSPRMLFTALL
ncbi:hypothetical protein WOC76_05910 [Methylocystis sp. IM3]|uniref:hypothetical protein n=1 Tax=unclassified Methylocystis TaxID=2625913 RepID=UPI0030FA4520